jgi:hypothetical protein
MTTNNRIGVLEGWAKTVNRTARTQAAREGLERKFEREVDPDGLMDPETRAKAVEAHRKAYYLRLAQKSAAARAAKAS